MVGEEEDDEVSEVLESEVLDAEDELEVCDGDDVEEVWDEVEDVDVEAALEEDDVEVAFAVVVVDVDVAGDEEVELSPKPKLADKPRSPTTEVTPLSSPSSTSRLPTTTSSCRTAFASSTLV